MQNNGHGEFVWYELMTRDAAAAAWFYADVVGWHVTGPAPDGSGYREIAAGREPVGGMLELTDEMCEHGARPTWSGYVAVDDVDAALATIERLGGRTLMPPRDLPGVGRIAMPADPEGVTFYVIRTAAGSPPSRAFSSTAHGHCSWNELTAADQDPALAFYGRLFGWTNTESMPMGELGQYRLLDLDGTQFGAVAPHTHAEASSEWLYYFRVPDVRAAVDRARARGGTIVLEPHDVPPNDEIVIGTDPEDATFALVATKAD